MKIKVDVLISTRDRSHELLSTLAGLAAQSGPRLRIVVGDASVGRPSFDTPAVRGLVRLLTHQGHHVELIRCAELLPRADADHVLFLDGDVWLEPGSLQVLYRAIRTLGCGVVGYAPQRLSLMDTYRPDDLTGYEEWAGRPQPERLAPGPGARRRGVLHHGANLLHLAAELNLRPDEWRAYKIACIDGCVLYDRAILLQCGGLSRGDHEGAQRRIMARHGAAGIVPSRAVRLESAA